MSKIESKYTLYDNLDELLAPDTLSELLSQPVTRVDYQPMKENGGSAGGKLSYVDTDTDRLVLKRMSIEHDWIMYATNDQQCRSIRLWQYGLLDELRPHLEHKIIACARDGDGWGILMHDLSDGLLKGWETSIPPKLVPVFLDRLARIHATFWNDPRLQDPRLGLCAPAKRLDYFSLTLAKNHKGDQRGPIPGWIREGWKIMETALDRDVFLILRRLQDDPQPLLDAMDRYPKTLMHGDYRDANLAYMKADQTVAFDWQSAASSMMTTDLAWYIPHRSVQVAMGKTRVIRYYRERLEGYLNKRFADMDWEAMIGLGNLHHALLIICLPAFFSVHADDPEHRAHSEKDLQETNQQVRDGMRWL